MSDAGHRLDRGRCLGRGKALRQLGPTSTRSGRPRRRRPETTSAPASSRSQVKRHPMTPLTSTSSEEVACAAVPIDWRALLTDQSVIRRQGHLMGRAHSPASSRTPRRGESASARPHTPQHHPPSGREPPAVPGQCSREPHSASSSARSRGTDVFSGANTHLVGVKRADDLHVGAHVSPWAGASGPSRTCGCRGR